MKRSAVYHKDNDHYRVVSLSGGFWQFQRHDGSKGTKVPHNDPWKGLRRATDWLTAKVQLDTLTPPKELAQAA